MLKIKTKQLALHADVGQEDKQLRKEGVKVVPADQGLALAEIGIWCQLISSELPRYFLERFEF